MRVLRTVVRSCTSILRISLRPENQLVYHRFPREERKRYSRHPPFHDLLLRVLLGLGGLLDTRWARNRAARGPTPRKAATPLHKHSQDPKPFPGLTHKPRCARVSRRQRRPLPLRVSRQRRFPPHRDGHARWTPLSSSVPSRAAPSTGISHFHRKTSDKQLSASTAKSFSFAIVLLLSALPAEEHSARNALTAQSSM